MVGQKPILTTFLLITVYSLSFGQADGTLPTPQEALASYSGHCPVTSSHGINVVGDTNTVITTKDYAGHCSGSAPPTDGCCKRLGINVDEGAGFVVTASSVYSSSYATTSAGLFHATYGWASRLLDVNQWIQVDLRRPRTVSGLLLQGSATTDEWTTSLRVLFSDDGIVFSGTGVIEGTFDHHTIARRLFDRPIVARYFRINPLTWYRYNTLRFDLLGCRE